MQSDYREDAGVLLIGVVFTVSVSSPCVQYILLLLFWHAPLGVRSAIRRHQPTQRAILSQINCFVQCKVVGSQVSLDSVQPRDTGIHGGLFQFCGGGAVRIILASVSSSIHAMCPNMEID